MLCIPDVPFAGEYRIDMQDSFVDGWQTSTTDGGPGLTVTLNDGTTIEVGLCSPYEVPSYACFANLSEGTQYITIPEGTTSAVWTLPGDAYGEISFQIYAPSGNLIADIATGYSGEVALNLCDE